MRRADRRRWRFASRVHHAYALIDWSVARPLWLGSLSASAGAMLWIRMYPIDATSVRTMKILIAGAVKLMAFGMLLQSICKRLDGTRAPRRKSASRARRFR